MLTFMDRDVDTILDEIQRLRREIVEKQQTLRLYSKEFIRVWEEEQKEAFNALP